MNAKDIAGVYATAHSIHTACDAASAQLGTVHSSDPDYVALTADIRALYAEFKELADDLVSGIDQLAKPARPE